MLRIRHLKLVPLFLALGVLLEGAVNPAPWYLDAGGWEHQLKTHAADDSTIYSLFSFILPILRQKYEHDYFLIFVLRSIFFTLALYFAFDIGHLHGTFCELQTHIEAAKKRAEP